MKGELFCDKCNANITYVHINAIGLDKITKVGEEVEIFIVCDVCFRDYKIDKVLS